MIPHTSTRSQGNVMKRTVLRTHRAPLPAVDLKSAAQWEALADALEDPVSESSIDYDDEREAMEVVAPGAIRSPN
jgi:hypothetical protein